MGLNIVFIQFFHGSVYNSNGELKWTVTENGFRFEMNGKEYKPGFNQVMDESGDLRLGGSDTISAFNVTLFKLIAVYCYGIIKTPELNSLTGWDFFEKTGMLQALSGNISSPDVSWQCYEDGIRIIASGKEHILKFTELYLYKEDYWKEIYPDIPFSLCQMLICFSVMIKALVAKRPKETPAPKPEPKPVAQATPAGTKEDELDATMPLPIAQVQAATQGQGAPLQRQPAPAAQAVPQGQGVPLQRQPAPAPQGQGVPLQRQPAPAAQAAPQGQGALLQRQPAPAVQTPQTAPVQQPTPAPSVAVPKAPSQMAPQSIAPVTAPKNAVPSQIRQPEQSAADGLAQQTSVKLTGVDADLSQLSPLEMQALQDYFDEMCLEFKNIEKSVRKYYPSWDLEDIKSLSGIEFIKEFIKKIS